MVTPHPTLPGPLTVTARAASISSLTALGLLHAAWAAGSSWPAPSRRDLAEAVVGAQVPPARTPTAVVAAALLASAAAVSGVLGRPRAARGTAVLLGGAFLARAAVGGAAAATAITSTAPSARFTSLDRRVYRPLCTAIGVALFVTAADRA